MGTWGTDKNHKHNYVVVGQTVKTKRGKTVVYIFYRCNAKGVCDQRDKLEIKRI